MPQPLPTPLAVETRTECRELGAFPSLGDLTEYFADGRQRTPHGVRSIGLGLGNMTIATDGIADVADAWVDIEKTARVGQARIGRWRNEGAPALRRTTPSEGNNEHT